MNVSGDTYALAQTLQSEIAGDVDAFTDACSRYQTAIIQANRLQRKKVRAEELASAKVAAQLSGISGDDESQPFGFHRPEDKVISRWSEELANRRQYLTFLLTLQEELHTHIAKVKDLHDNVNAEMENVNKLVSEKNSVPKKLFIRDLMLWAAHG
jgi:hypothetical protein